MTKFILIMFICSHVPGNDCKPIPTPIKEFNTYYECAIYGYNYSAALLTDMTTDVVDTYRAFTMFNCKKNSSV
tara:strand:+ start:337 stop:555 length:219 start_codon:yes stop_codon:yes gene_type:complete